MTSSAPPLAESPPRPLVARKAGLRPVMPPVGCSWAAGQSTAPLTSTLHAGTAATGGVPRKGRFGGGTRVMDFTRKRPLPEPRASHSASGYGWCAGRPLPGARGVPGGRGTLPTGNFLPPQASASRRLAAAAGRRSPVRPLRQRKHEDHRRHSVPNHTETWPDVVAMYCVPSTVEVTTPRPMGPPVLNRYSTSPMRAPIARKSPSSSPAMSTPPPVVVTAATSRRSDL